MRVLCTYSLCYSTGCETVRVLYTQPLLQYMVWDCEGSVHTASVTVQGVVPLFPRRVGILPLFCEIDLCFISLPLLALILCWIVAT